MTQESGFKGFDKLTERARAVLISAQTTASTDNQPKIDTSHLLVAVLQEKDQYMGDTFTSRRITLEFVRPQLEITNPRRDQAVTGDIGLTKDAKESIMLAADSAREYGDAWIGPVHLAKGILRVKEGTAMRIIETLGVTQEEILAALDESKKAAELKAKETKPLTDPETRFTSRLHEVIARNPEDADRIYGALHAILNLADHTDITYRGYFPK